VPYQSCQECGLRTYYVSGEECPRCGTPLGAPRGDARGLPEWPGGSGPQGAVERMLALARRELKMDVALLSEARHGHEVVLWAVSNGRLPAFAAGAEAPLGDTICQRLLDGAIDSIVHDTGADPRVRGLPVVRATGLGAYIGVPITAQAARRYVLCCLAAEARPDLTDADVRFLWGLVESVRPVVDRVAAAR
jgi:GAF domain-containing protein